MKERRLKKEVKCVNHGGKFKQGVIYITSKLIGCKVEVIYHVDDTLKPLQSW